MAFGRTALPVSVAMPVYNALPYLDEAVQSILDQTWPDFEFVIYDDGSTDGSFDRLQEWASRDRRIVLTRGERNLGPAASSNEVVRRSSAPLIARMDADDVSQPDRLERQLETFAQYSGAGIVASLCDVIDPEGRLVRGPELWRLTRNSWFTPFAHGSMMFQRELYDKIGGYRDECEFWEDLDFVLRASAVTRIFVLPQALYRYRQSYASARLVSSQLRVERAMDLRYRSVDRIRRNLSYDDLLRAGPVESNERVDPRVFISLGLLAMWSGRRHNIVRRFLKRARLRADKPTLLSAVWVCWSSVSPRTLRSLMSFVSRIRNRSLGAKPFPDQPFEWKTPDARPTATMPVDQQLLRSQTQH